MTARSVTLVNLTPGTSYQAQVRAVSDVGSGPFSDVRTLSTYRGLLGIIPIPSNIVNLLFLLFNSQYHWNNVMMLLDNVPVGYNRVFCVGC